MELEISDNILMGMLDRYKKKGGFVQLVQLIETTAKPKQDQFLQLIKNENALWEETVRNKVLTYEKILAWPSEALAEVFSRVQHLTTAVLFKDHPEDDTNRCLGFLSHSERRKIQDLMDSKQVTPADKLTCAFKLVSEVRALIMQGTLKVEKFAPDLFIPEDIEEKLLHQAEEASSAQILEYETPEPTPSPEVKAENKHDTSNHREEIEFLKRKVNALVSENSQLKHELSVIRGKLDQIRKIA